MLRTTIGARYSSGTGVGTCENWSGSYRTICMMRGLTPNRLFTTLVPSHRAAESAAYSSLIFCCVRIWWAPMVKTVSPIETGRPAQVVMFARYRSSRSRPSPPTRGRSSEWPARTAGFDLAALSSGEQELVMKIRFVFRALTVATMTGGLIAGTSVLWAQDHHDPYVAGTSPRAVEPVQQSSPQPVEVIQQTSPQAVQQTSPEPVQQTSPEPVVNAVGHSLPDPYIAATSPKWSPAKARRWWPRCRPI
jgi:hypothetical protein